jgi:ABC-type glycerol-3-phosphate transport system substrate-binding protein
MLVNRRQAISKIAAVSAGLGVAVVAAGIGGYLAGTQTAPARTVEKTVTTSTALPTTYVTTAASAVKPIEVWWVTEFFPEEQLAFMEIANDFTKETGIPVHVTFYDFQAAEAKLFTAIKTGQVPDMSNDIGTAIGTRLAWEGALLDVSDVIEDLKKTGDLIPVAPENCYIVDGVSKKRSYFQFPQALQPFVNTYWADVLEKYTGVSKPPEDWNDWWGIFKKAQDNGAMKDLGMYAFGFCLYSAGGDSEDAFSETMFAYGGKPLTEDGKVNYKDPAFKKAVTETLEFIVDLYKGGYIPPGATAWDDSSNNVAVESKKVIMTYSNGSLSIPLWFFRNQPENYKNYIYWADFPKKGPYGNEYKLSVIGGTVSFIMKDGKNTEGAKQFLEFFMKPENYNKWFLGYGYRYLPVLKSSLETLQLYKDPNDHNIYPSKFYLERATADYRYINPVWGKASYGEHIWSNMVTSVLVKNVPISDAIDAAFSRLEELSKQYGE